MNHVTNWIQEDNFKLLHNMRGAKFSLLDSMRGAKCTICKAIDMLKIDCFARKNQFTGVLLALHANNWLYGRIFHNIGIFLQNINISDRIRFKTAQYCRFVSKFCTGMSVHGDAEQEVVSHPFPPALPIVCAASVLPFNPCQCARHYKLYSRPPCIVLNLCFWFRPGISQSLGLECVTDAPARSSRCSSACDQLEKALMRIIYLRSPAANCGKYLPRVAFQLHRERRQF